MTNEEMVKQQAQFTTNLGRVESTLETVVNVLAKVADTQLRMAEAQASADSRIAEIGRAHV